jgi:hypothetical protein
MTCAIPTAPRAARLVRHEIATDVPCFLFVQAQQDTTAPVLVGLTISPQQVDTTAEVANVSFLVHGTDNISGIIHVQVNVVSPSGKIALGIAAQTLLSGTPLDGTFQPIFNMPAHSEAGVWTVSSVAITDQVYNRANYSTAQLQAAGLPTSFVVTDLQSDITAPVLTGLSISPQQVDTGSGPANVTFSVHATDDISGIIHAQVNVVSPSGKIALGIAAQTLLSGTPLDGTFQPIFNMPAHSETGVWTISSVAITDQVYNRANYSTAQLQAAGLPTTFTNVVTSPYKASVQPPINADDSGVFSAKRGVIPIKFTLTRDDLATCALPDATISLSRIAGGVLGSIDEGTYVAPSDSGSDFRIDPTACQYIYNLAVSSLGVGSYRVNISVNGTVVGHAVFALK